MKSEKKVLMGSGSIAIVATVITIQLVMISGGFSENNSLRHADLTVFENTQKADAIPVQGTECLPSSLGDLANEITFQYKTPTVVPNGYDLQAIDHLEDNWLILYYWDQSMCPFEYTSRDFIMGGAIAVVAYPMKDNVDASKYVNDFMGHPDRNTNANWHPITLEGNLGTQPAAGTEPFKGTVSSYVNGDLEEQTKRQAPAGITFVSQEDNVRYKIRAFMPLDDLKTVAESLQ